MKLTSIYRSLLFSALLGGALAAAEKPTTFYFVDVGAGNATFVVPPSGKVVLMDTGSALTANRVIAFMRQNRIPRIDYLLISHFEEDHMGAAAKIAAEFPIVNWVDHGETVTYHKSDEWWAQRRSFGKPPSGGAGKFNDVRWETFRAAREKGRHLIVKTGDKLPVEGLDATVLNAAGKVIASPLKGAGAPNPSCSGWERRGDDDAEDSQSVGVLFTVGKFRFVNLGDLTWNLAHSLFCPNNKVGQVDAYLITHHAQSMRVELGLYAYGLSCCSAAEVHGLHPRVAVLSYGRGGHRTGTPAAMKVVRDSPGLESLWQTEKVVDGGEKETNPPDDFIANIGENGEQVPYIKIEAMPDGSFTVVNSRNQFSRHYEPRK